MENRQVPLRSRRVCRFCLTESEPLSFIYDQNLNKPFQVPLTLQVMSCVAIEVYAADGMPQMICNMCRWNLDRSYKFKQQCKKADEALRNYPISGVLPRPFPPIPNDPPERGMKRAPEQSNQNDQSKKTRLDNGDRERRETREREKERQSERQREKSDQRRDLYEEEQEVVSEQEMETSNEKEEGKLEPGEIRVHACDQCDRTFPLRQALALHILRAHRDRNYKCTECDRMFFSKYDLGKHMATHSEEKPYACPICNKQFTRANLLQRHEKVHREELRYGCQHCDREFFTTEELDKHEESAHKSAKPYQCNICNKRFTYKQGLERHEMLHSEDKSFSCEYCKEAFRTSTKLARHLTTHAGHRPYLCKLCPRTFLLSHHLTRHMRTHSVEKRHVCEDCGKAFKRKESLDVHQLTHTKRTGPGLTCDVCQESCRNRADYVTHIKQHIEAGEKMGPDGLQPDNKDKLDLEESDEEEDDDQYSDDDYEPPAYVVKKLPKAIKRSASDEEAERQENEEASKEQVVFLRGKDGNMVKKTIKTLMPMRRDATVAKSSPGTPSNSKDEGSSTKVRGVDETEAQVQKIVASVFKEHKIPLKHQNVAQEQSKESSGATVTPVTSKQLKDDKSDSQSSGNGPSVVAAVKVIKRIVVRKPGPSDATPGSVVAASSATTPVPTTNKEQEGAVTSTPVTSTSQTSSTGTPKVMKRVIVRRIIRQGDTTREVVMNPDGTIIDPAELAKIPTRNVVKRLVVKKPLDKSQASTVQALLQSVTDQRQTTFLKTSEASSESPKFELKTSQPSTSQKSKEEGDKETKEKLEQLEKRVEQQRLKIEELQARKQQEYEPADEMLPERHDESEDEQQLPLKRVFVKRKQSIYDEEQEYHDTDTKVEEETLKKEAENTQTESKKMEDEDEFVIETPKRDANSKVYGNKKTMQKAEEATQDVEEMSQELCNILDSTDNVVKMQENVLSNLTQISAIPEAPVQKWYNAEDIKNEEETTSAVEESTTNKDEVPEEVPAEKVVEQEKVNEEEKKVEKVQEEEVKNDTMETQEVEQEEEANMSLVSQGSTDIFEGSETEKSTNALEESVIELNSSTKTINLSDTNDSRDSLEDKLSQMEG